jgi:hypothetical protein
LIKKDVKKFQKINNVNLVNQIYIIRKAFS